MITAAVVNDVTEEALISRLGTPELLPAGLIVRSDNGPQFTAHAGKETLKRGKVYGHFDLKF